MSKVSEFAELEIQKLQNNGLSLTTAEIVWLNDLGCKMENPSSRVDPAKAGKPVRAGNVWLWPITISASEWFFKIAFEHYQTEQGQTYALGFALANGRRPNRFATLRERSQIRRAVNRWALRCGATEAELREAILRVLPETDTPHALPPSDASTDGAGVSGFIAELEAATGKPESYWLAKSSENALRVLSAVYAQAAAGFGGVDDDGKREYQDAMADFDKAIMAIKAARNGE